MTDSVSDSPGDAPYSAEAGTWNARSAAVPVPGSLADIIPVINTQHLRIDMPFFDDLPDLSFHARDARVARLVGGRADLAPSRKARHFLQRGKAAIHDGQARAIRFARTGRLIGALDLQLTGRTLDISFWTGDVFRRQGYASEAIAGMARFFFGENLARQINARPHSCNAAAIRVLEKNGFEAPAHPAGHPAVWQLTQARWHARKGAGMGES